MSAKQLDFTSASCNGSPCEQGATFSRRLTWEKEQPANSGIFVPVDISFWTAKMQVRKKAGAAILIELSTVNGRITLGGVTGNIDLFISATDTDALVPGVYKYDLELTSDSGFVYRFVEGDFEVKGQITDE